MVALRHMMTAILGALAIAQRSVSKGLFEPDVLNHLVARQNGVVNGNICAQLNLSILGITIVKGLCLCAQGGVLTPASVLSLNQQITANSGLLAPVINLVGGLAGAITTITSNALPLLLSQPTSCRYPANSTPNACGSCGYACFSNSTVTYVSCGSSCILKGTPCISGVPGRKREETFSRRSFKCPSGLDACLVPGRSSVFGGYECIDTSSDLESCGGCVSPFPGDLAGEDCSSLPNVASASCVGGKCQIVSCLKGHKFDGVGCAPTGERPLVGYWAALAESARAIREQ